MKLIEKLKQIDTTILFVPIFIGASILYLYNISFSEIWIDEAFTKALVRHSYGDMVGLLSNDFHPPLYFFGLKAFAAVFGLTDFTIRLFSVLGMLATLVLVRGAGQKVFGKTGSLSLCLLIAALPMFAEYTHEARMYTWGAFAVAGVFIYAARVLLFEKRGDLLWLAVFSVLAAYIHYYALLAAFWANVFVAMLLYLRQRSRFKFHLLASITAFVVYLPWLAIVLGQTKKVAAAYWVPAVSWDSFLSCLLSPFSPKIYLPPFLPLAVLFYLILLWVVVRTFVAGKGSDRLVLGLSMTMFWCTVGTAILFSLFLQPILYMRYFSVIIVLLLIPVALFFTSPVNRYVKGIVLAAVVILGVKVSVEGSTFSFGPYRQSVEYLREKHPEVRKIFHVVESTGGPFAECDGSGVQNYWYNPAGTVVYTNMDVFDNLIQTDSLGEVLRDGEPFCLASFPFLPFNENNVQRILSESGPAEIDTVYDKKMTPGITVVLYTLNYRERNTK